MSDAALESSRETAAERRVLMGKRILFVVGPMELGGSERQALLFARYLKNEQHADVQVWGTMGEPGRLAAICDKEGIKWRIVPEPWVWNRFQRPQRLASFARQLRSAQPEIILPYMSMPSQVCSLVWRWTGAKLCIWNQRDYGLTRLGTRYEKWAVQRASSFIANSNYIQQYLVQELKVDPQRVRVVHNGIDLAESVDNRDEWRKRLGLSDELVACMVANLHADKDHATLLKSWGLVLDRLRREPGKDAVLLLAGRFDATHERLKALAFDLKLGDRVRFLGGVNDVAGLLRAVDVAVFSSRSEGSPNAVLESMAAGLAVVATDIPAIREAMPPESLHYLSPPNDEYGMAENILRLFADRELRNTAGALNRQRVESEYSSQQMCQTMVQVIVNGL